MEVLVPYQEQYSKFMSTHYKKISSIIMKFMEIKSITPMESGQNQEDYYQAFKTLFGQRYTSLTKFNDY